MGHELSANAGFQFSLGGGGSVRPGISRFLDRSTSFLVVDRNRITGAGVTAGLDFGLSIVKQLRDKDYAKAVQLLAEYQPEPPLDAGTPDRAGQAATKLLTDMTAPFVDKVRAFAGTNVR